MAKNSNIWTKGVFRYNVPNIWQSLKNNVGNFGVSDGYGVTIGTLADPYFNIDSDADVPFKSDKIRQSSSDYISYINSLSIDAGTRTINDVLQTSRIASGDNISNNASQLEPLSDTFKRLSSTKITPDGSDTYLANLANYYVALNLDEAYKQNSGRKIFKKGISSDIDGYFGINEYSESNGDIFTRYQIGDNSGRLNAVFHEGTSPIYDKTFQNIGSISGKWRNYYNLLNRTSHNTLAYIYGSIYGADLISDLSKFSDDFFNSNGIEFNYNTYITSRKSRYTFDSTYLDKMTSLYSSSNNTGYYFDLNGNIIRYALKNVGNSNNNGAYEHEYGESQTQIDDGVKVTGAQSVNGSFNAGIMSNAYTTYDSDNLLNNDDLIAKTNNAFVNGEYHTIISRFYNGGNDEKNYSIINTAIDEWTKQYGMSHGRNLLIKDAGTKSKIPKYNGYEDPYCRVWTYHHQYHTLVDAIRPFMVDDYTVLKQGMLAGDSNLPEKNKYHWNLFSAREMGNGWDGGRNRLGQLGVINQNNGLVNFAPIKGGKLSGDMYKENNQKSVQMKKCMFSIENLAWEGQEGKSGYHKLSREQIGPLGGRIMWFPPYNLTFNESTNSPWNQTDIIGRGEPIYTYTNTKRSGTLSFTLLIDHPSVVDYWKFHHNKDNGDGEEDGLKGDEQTLLRFFAGCDVLVPQPFYFDTPKAEEKKGGKPDEIKPDTKKSLKKIVFMVFYPNNYSGMDDEPNTYWGGKQHTKINAIEYLLNGVGTQTQVILSASQKLQDIPTSMNVFYEKLGDEEVDDGQTVRRLRRFGGYEMSDIYGVSPVNSFLQCGFKEKYYGKTAVGYLISALVYPSPSSDYDTVKKAGEGDNLALSTRYVNPNDWKVGDANWFYRVDANWCGQRFRDTQANYLDKKSFGLNSKVGYEKLRKTVIEKNIVDEKQLNESSVTFVTLSDVYAALHPETTDETSGVLYSYYDSGRTEICKVLSQSASTITKIEIIGDASVHGYGTENAADASYWWRHDGQGIKKTKFPKDKLKSANYVLGCGRAETVHHWLASELKGFKDSNFVVTATDESQLGPGDSLTVSPNSEFTVKNSGTSYKNAEMSLIGNTYDNPDETTNETDEMEDNGRVEGDVDAFHAKFYRNAIVTITYQVDGTGLTESTSVSDAKTVAQGTNETIKTDDETTKALQEAERINGKAKEKSKTVSTASGDTLFNNTKSNLRGDIFGNNIINKDWFESTYSTALSNKTDELGNKAAEAIKKSNTALTAEEKEINDYKTLMSTEENAPLNRYDMESIFFNLLEVNDPMLHHKITDKIKYFDPAFHSITPEGFNARLTFLQQCMRQGGTNSANEAGKNTGNANNLAFGRPPVCVLRIGDFYNTKIIPSSLNIDYSESTWDLNIEGIGVQPMMAKVTLSFDFIGGSDLGGPISRLQNALSFNYYANAGVYDNRAEAVEYESGTYKNEPTKFKGVNWKNEIK